MRLLQPALHGIAMYTIATVAHPLDSVNPFRSLSRRAESPDNSCGLTGAGNSFGYSCGASNLGPCCSQHGWCGATDAYCGTGCQSKFGQCDPDTDPNDDGTCGPANGNKVCSDGKCCSPSGFCGTTKDHCKSPDCLRGFGKCDADQVPPGTSTGGAPRLLIGSVAFGADIYACEEPGTIALTYDDGPYIYTAGLLDLLASHNAKATFFVTGVNLGKGRIDDESTPWPAIIKRMAADGHQIASHSWSHADLSKLSETERRDEMIKNEMAIRNILGYFPTYMRPPYSSCNAACMNTMRDLGYHIISFDLDTEDYLHPTPFEIQISKDIVSAAIQGKDSESTAFLSIMHDIQEQTANNLTSYFLTQLTTKGYRTVPVGECLKDPRANWYRTA
ncbi:hypothetical protein BDZ91DRAFT_298776 [Kalaharituber pfeilii]|nr:hypothetical protein BDZ91DRAFT_298776 [Kalaharituber pfeilii]